MSRSEKIRKAIEDDHLVTYHGRFVGTPSQLAYLTGVAYGTIKNSYQKCKVRSFYLSGSGVLIDALDLAAYFEKAKRGRPPKAT